MQKIYFNSKPLFLCSELTGEIDVYYHRQDTIFLDELNIHSLKTMVHEMQQPEVHAGIFLHHDVGELLEAFKKQFTVIQAGGGFVTAPANHLLVIFRRGKWDLPKGKLDEGESLEECAVREVEEETGLQNVILNSPLGITFHTYHEKDQFILKESHWYLMEASSQQKMTPQQNEDIEACKWVAINELDHYLENMHPSVADVIRLGLSKIKAV